MYLMNSMLQPVPLLLAIRVPGVALAAPSPLQSYRRPFHHRLNGWGGGRLEVVPYRWLSLYFI